MKKMLCTLAAFTLVSTANAADLTVVYNRDETHKVNGAGISLGKTFGGLNYSVSIDRFAKKNNDIDMFSVNASYEIIKVLGMGVSPGVGLGYLRQEQGKNGVVMNAGVGLSYPITKKFSVVTDFYRTYGQESIKNTNATVASVGIKTTF